MPPSPGSSPPPEGRTRRRPGSIARRLFAGGVAVATAGTALVLVYAGWWLHERDPGEPVSVKVDRPISVLREAGGGSDTLPNVLGLDADTARRAMADAGVDPARLSTKPQPYAGEANVVVAQTPPAGAKLGDPVVLAVSSPAQVPQLVGRQVDDAREQLSDLGARVLVKSRFSPGADEGDVLATAPAAGAQLDDTATLTVAEAPSSTFLTSLTSIASDCDTEEGVSVNGEEHEQALTCSPGAGSPSTSAYLLNRRVARFVATVGLSDRGGSDSPVRFRVLVDGRTRFAETVAFGDDVQVDIPVEGALRIELEARLAATQDPDESPVAVWGDARLLGGQESIDALERESE